MYASLNTLMLWKDLREFHESLKDLPALSYRIKGLASLTAQKSEETTKFFNSYWPVGAVR